MYHSMIDYCMRPRANLVFRPIRHFALVLDLREKYLNNGYFIILVLLEHIHAANYIMDVVHSYPKNLKNSTCGRS